MAAINWKKGVSGSWTVAANWNPAKVPGSADDATIGVAGLYTVSLTGATPVTVHSITISDLDATLAIAAPGKTEKVTTNLSNAGTVAIDAANGGGTTLNIGGALKNTGLFTIGNLTNTSGTGALTTVSAASLANTGEIDIFGSSFSSVLAVKAAAPATLTGAYDLAGNALLQFGSGAITTIAGHASLTIDGPQARVALAGNTGTNSALTKLATNAGTFVLADSAFLTTTTGLANQGLIEVGANVSGLGDAGGSSLAIGGALTNNGDLDIGNTGLTSPVNVHATSLVNAPAATISLVGGTGPGGGEASLTINGAAPAALTGAYWLQGNALLQFGSGNVTSVASNSVLRLDGAQSRITNNTAGNSALTKLATNNGLFELEDHASVAIAARTTFNNFGMLEVDALGGGGSRLVMNGMLNNVGSLAIGGTSLVLGAAPSIVTAAGLIDPGTIEMVGGPGRATLDILGAALPTVTNSISLQGNALLEFGSGSITAIGDAGVLSLDGPNARVALNSDTTKSGALAGLASNTGEFLLADGATVATKVAFVNNGGVSVDAFGFSAFLNDGGSSLAIGGALTNNDNLNIGNRTITAATTVSANGLANPGVIQLTGNTTAPVQASLIINAAAPGLLTGHAYNLAGDALLQFSGGGITTIGAGTQLSLDGALSRVGLKSSSGSNSALTGLTNNQGSFFLADGAKVSTSKPLANSGALDIDENGNGGSSLTVTGVLTNTGGFNIGNGGIAAATTVTAGGLVNKSTIDLTGAPAVQATLNIKAAAPAVIANSTYNLQGDALLEFTGSAGIGAIGGGGILSLDGAKSRVGLGPTSTNSALTKLANNSGRFMLGDGAAVTTSVGFANAGTAQIDGALPDGGGSNLKIGGTLNNTGTLTVGNSGIGTAVTVTATGLVNTGTVDVTGGSARATLNITAAAPKTLTGTLGIFGNALVQFAGSGLVGTIGSGASVTLDGAQARLALAGKTTTNSALTALTTVGGGLGLEDGAVLATTVGLTDSGFLGVDNFGGGGSSLTIGGAVTDSGNFQIGSTAIVAATKVGTKAFTNNEFLTLTSGAANATLTVTGAFTNTGTVQLDTTGGGGSTLAITGALTNNGVLNLGNSSITKPTKATAASLANTGTIQLAGGSTAGGGTASASLTIAAAAPSTWTGSATLSGNSLLQFGGSALIANVGAGARISLDGAKSSLGLAGKGNNSALGKLTSNAGTFSLGDGAALTTTVGLNNTGTVSIDGSFPTLGGSSLTIGGILTNSGTLDLGNPNITAAANVKAAGLANSGLLTIGGGTGQAQLNITGAAPSTLQGNVQLQGNALLTFGGTTGITAIASGAGLTLDGAQAHVQLTSKPTNNSALTGLGSNAGTFIIEDGAAVTTAGALTNTRFIELDPFGATGGGSLSIGGLLTNSSFISIGGNLSNESTLTTVGLTNTNTGTISLTGGGAAPAVLNVNGALSNSGTLDIDASGLGGSKLTVAGLLTNSGTLEIGNAAIKSPSAAAANALANTSTGNIDFNGGSASSGGSARASLMITAAAPATWTGTADLSGNSLLQFGGSAGITGIGGSSRISIDGKQSFVALASAPTSNSALKGMANIAGTFGLGDGAVLTTTGALSNSGTLDIDTPPFATIAGGSTLTVAGALTNTGTVQIGNTSLAAATNVSAAGLVNSGTVNLAGGTARATLNIMGAAPATLAGTYSLQGNSLLEFAGSTGVTTIGSGASLTLNGAKAFVALSSNTGSNSALTKLASNIGTFDLEGGAELTTTTGFNNGNTAALRVDTQFGAGGGSNLKLGGALTNSGNVTIGNSSIAAATIVSATSLANTGTVNLSGGSSNSATLSLAGASTDGGNVTVSGGGVLKLGGTLTVTNQLVLNNGTVSGGSLAGAGTMEVGFFNTGTLDHVTIAGGATFTAQFGGTLDVNTITVSGALTGTTSTTLAFLNHGTDNMTNVSGFPAITLANGAANSLTLTDANFTGVGGNVITVTDGDSGNTVNAATLSAANAITVNAGAGADTLTGGAGNDTFVAGGKTTMTGNAGSNEFTFLAPGGANFIKDFGASPTNELVFSNAGFNLGQSGAGSTPLALPTALFTANATGSFSNTSQRLAYNTTNGSLFADADGSGGGSSKQLVATLTSAPSIAAASQLFFIS